MASTTYTVIANDTVTSEGVSKKANAIDTARLLRDAEGVNVRVETNKGTVVFEQAAPKKINMSAPYTRTVNVTAEQAEMINGQRVAYKRTRVGFALLDAARGDYSIYDLVNKQVVGDLDIATTRDAGRWFADEAPALRASLTNA